MKTLKNFLALLLIVAMMVPLVTPAFASTYAPYTGSSNSLVDGLNNISVDSSFAHRTEIAKANGIYNYSGTAEENLLLLNLLRQGELVIPGTEDTGGGSSNPPVVNDNSYYPACASHHTSLVDALTSLGIDASFSNRCRIAAANNVGNYEGSAVQNTEMLRALKEGRLRNPDCVVTNSDSEENSASDYVEEPVMEESYDLPPAEESQFEEVQNSETTTKVPEIVAVENNEVETYYFSDSSESEIGDYFPAYSGPSQSFVDALGELSIDSSFNYRKSIAFVNNIPEYTGSASENITLFSLLKAGRLLKPSTEEPITETYSPEVSTDNENINMFISEENNEYELSLYDDNDVLIEIIKNNAPIREKDSRWADVAFKCNTGVVFKVNSEKVNFFGNLWYGLEYNSTLLYVYSGNVKIHECAPLSFTRYGVEYSICKCGNVSSVVKSVNIAQPTAFHTLVNGEDNISEQGSYVRKMSMAATAPDIMQYAVTAVATSQVDGPILPFGDMVAAAILIYAAYVYYLDSAPSLEFDAEVEATLEKVDADTVKEFRNPDNAFCIVERPEGKGNLICIVPEIDMAGAYALVLNGFDVYTENKKTAERLAAMHIDTKTYTPRYYFDFPHASEAPYSYPHFHLGKVINFHTKIKDVPSHIFYGTNIKGQRPEGYILYDMIV